MIEDYWTPAVSDWVPQIDGKYVLKITMPIRILTNTGIEHLAPGSYILTYENSVCVRKEIIYV